MMINLNITNLLYIVVYLFPHVNFLSNRYAIYVYNVYYTVSNVYI